MENIMIYRVAEYNWDASEIINLVTDEEKEKLLEELETLPDDIYTEIPEGWTDVEPPKESSYRLVFDWETNEWVETATEWQKKGFETEEEMVYETKLKEIEQQAQVSYQKQTEVLNKFLLNQLDNMIYSGAMTEEEALEYVNAYPPFEIGVAYKAKDKVQYDDVVYEVIQEHTSQVDWLPNAVPALFKVYLGGTTEDGEQVIHDWVQPAGAHDAYKKGDVVVFNGKVYESTIDDNVWSPVTHGWKEILK